MLKNSILNKNKYDYYLFLIVLFVLTCLMIFCFMPLNKLNYGHDVLFHYRRISALMVSLREKSYPVYLDFSALENYGYGTNLFYADFLLIPFAIIGNLTSFIFSYKLLLFTITFLCGVFTYKFVNRIYNNCVAASIASILYTFSMYRLQDMFERGALGETISFTILPLVAIGLYEILLGNYKKWYILTISFALLIYTHLLSTILIFILVAIFVCIYYKNILKTPSRIKYLAISAVITSILCVSFLLPFLEQILSNKFYFQTAVFDSKSELSLKNFVRSILFPYSTYSNPFEPFIGIVLVLIVSTRILIKTNKSVKSADIFTIMGITLMILTLRIFPWDRYPLKFINIIQFPWRLFEYSTFFFSIAGGLYLSILFNKKKQKIIYALIIFYTIIFIIVNASIHKKAIGYENSDLMGIKMDLNNYGWFFVGMEYIPTKLKSIEVLKERDMNVISKLESTTISNTWRKEGLISCNIQTNGKDKIEFPLIYYKGYTAIFNNKPVEVNQSDRGLVEVEVNETGKLTVAYTGTFIQKYSIYISLISIIIFIAYICINNRKRRINA